MPRPLIDYSVRARLGDGVEMFLGAGCRDEGCPYNRLV